MRKEIAPELYNYNKFPGPEFHVNGDKVETEGIAFTLVENIKDAFDVTVFNQRFSEVLTKFDYVVGDWSNEQLRLRGGDLPRRHPGGGQGSDRGRPLSGSQQLAGHAPGGAASGHQERAARTGQ